MQLPYVVRNNAYNEIALKKKNIAQSPCIVNMFVDMFICKILLDLLPVNVSVFENIGS